MKTTDKKPTLLIIDDYVDFREELIQSPILRKKYNLMQSESCEEALNFITTTDDIDFILLDYDFRTTGNPSRINGLELLKIIKKRFPEIFVIMTTGVIENRGQIAIEAIRNFADFYIDKPFKISKLEEIIDSNYKPKALEIERFENIIQTLKNNGFITNSIRVASQFEIALKIFNELNLPILITGETGTGKTLFARALHNASIHSQKTFYEFHCRQLLSDTNSARSQLFGHTKGAYTGAFSSKKGILDETFTILFDDIHHLHLDMHPFLLQLLESGIYTRLGDDLKKFKFNGKVLATSIYTTNELISREILSKELIYRFAGATIHIPPLRERKEDIPDIIQYYLQQIGKPDFKFDNKIIYQLQNKYWTGNTRELISWVKRAVIQNEQNFIDFDENTSEHQEYKEIMQKIFETINLGVASHGLEQIIKTIRRIAIITQLKIHKGNINKTAKALGYKNHRGLIYWIHKLNINLNDFKT